MKFAVANVMTHSVTISIRFNIQIWFSIHFQQKLEVITGGCAGTMQLQLFKGENLIAQLTDDDADLASYSIQNDMRIHVVDNVQTNIFGDANVEKFELSEKQYDEKRNTLRGFLKSNKLGKYNAEEMAAIEERKRQDELEQQQKADSINIGNRCLVTAKGPRRIGTVRYKGTFHAKPGIFIGVEFDEPLGIHDGRFVHEYFMN